MYATKKIQGVLKMTNAKPFLKWAGGKTQIRDELIARLPGCIIDNMVIDRYIEPFVGGGAIFFYLKNKYSIKESFLSDINREVVVGYKVIQNNFKKLINKLEAIEKEYLDKTAAKRQKYYYEIRNIYNKQMLDFDYTNYNSEWIKRASYLIFLNKTCFNGLFRQNKKGEFNVPHGGYKNPKICCTENIVAVNKALRNTKIVCGDFTKSEKYIDKGSFVYMDPPYLPLSRTSSFTNYSKEGFSVEDQKRLAEFFKKMNKKGIYLMLSNSDPKNEEPENDFFDKLFKEFTIEKILARRMISCNGSGRGQINELIIVNY